MRRLVIGVDSSTQSTKAELRDAESGDVLATGRHPHPPTSPPLSEQDPDAWWGALVEAVRQLGPAREHVVAISVAGQQHGLVAIDEAGSVLRPAKLWNDTMSAPQADDLVRSVGADWWAEWAGVVPVAAITISKLAWIAEHEPETFERIARVKLPHDWLTWKLSGAHVTDRGDASGTGWFNAESGATLIEPFKLIGAGHPESWAKRVPRVLGPTEVAGTLTPAAGDELGLPNDVVVGPGTGDNMGAALGLGLDEGDVVVSLGTSGTVFARTSRRAFDPSGSVAGFCDATGNYLPLVCTLNATKVTDTVAAWLDAEPAEFAELACSAVVGPLDATLVPYFDGERTPNRPDAKGIMVGLSTSTTRAEIARAAHDGVLCGLLDGLTALENTGAETSGRLLLVGGGSRSAAYRQRLADISDRVVSVPRDDETVATGAAVQAAAVAGHGSFDDIADRWRLRDATDTHPREGADGRAVRDRYAAASSFDVRLGRPAQSQ